MAATKLPPPRTAGERPARCSGYDDNPRGFMQPFVSDVDEIFLRLRYDLLSPIERLVST